MNDFRQHFLAESINNLNNLRNNLAECFTENLRRDTFRTIHTIKGSAQTFGLHGAARLAGELENTLSNSENLIDKNLLLEGIKLLTTSLQQGAVDSSADFIEKLGSKSKTATRSDVFLIRIPPKIFKNFSQTEQTAIISALRFEKNVFCAEADFEISSFANEYRDLQKLLNENGEIIASLPSEKIKSPGKIGFRIFLVSNETAESLQKFLKNYKVEISSYNQENDASNELLEMFSQIAAHGEQIAEKSGKEISITILASDTMLSVETIKAIFEFLLHLVRNAADHGIEQSGKIEIRLFDEDQAIHLSVADDGKGIDLLKVRARAVAKNLISEDDVLNEQQLLELIFAPELSTAVTVTEVSGRGIGLDAVRSSVEKLNGKISVKNRKTKGAIFEIILPHEKV